jgi:hypothetical protein
VYPRQQLLLPKTATRSGILQPFEGFTLFFAITYLSQPQPTEGNTPTPTGIQQPDQNKLGTTENKHKKTQAELDKELKMKMDGISGEGGESGVEYEDGKPVAMKRGVRENMFRYI